MIITERFKNAALAAQRDGYTHVASVCGAYKATTYVHRWSIDNLVSRPTGTRCGGRISPYQGMYTGRLNTRDLDRETIRYQTLMSEYATPQEASAS